MDRLNIEQTEKTPSILFDPQSGIFQMEGNSRPEDVRAFYYPIIEKIKAYFDNLVAQNNIDQFADNPFIAKFQLQYFNSSSAKFISDILFSFKEYADENINIEIEWLYDEGDEDMKEVGTDLSDMIRYNFKFVEIKK